MGALPERILTARQSDGAVIDSEPVGSGVEILLRGESQVTTQALGHVLGVKEGRVDGEIGAGIDEERAFSLSEGRGGGRRGGVLRVNRAEEDDRGGASGGQGGVADRLRSGDGEDVTRADGELGAARGRKSDVGADSLDLERVDAAEIQAGVAESGRIGGDAIGRRRGEYSGHGGSVEAIGLTAVDVREGDIRADP